MAERLNLLAWAILIMGFLMKIEWLLFIGLLFLLLFAIIRRVYLPFKDLPARIFGALSFIGVAASLIFYLYNPSLDTLYLCISFWLLAALFDLLTEIYYGK